MKARSPPPAERFAYPRLTGPVRRPRDRPPLGALGPWWAQRGLLKPPCITPADKLRHDCCVPVDADFQPQGEIGVQAFAGGKYACAPFQGTSTDIHAAWMNFYGQWLPQSGWQADDKPGIELYEDDFEMDPATGVFDCQLCVPVRPM